MAKKRVDQDFLDRAAEYVREVMTQRGIKQMVAAERWGVSQSTVSNVVNAEAIGIDVAARIVKAEGGSLDAMFGLAAGPGAKCLREADGWAAGADAAAAFVPRAIVDEAGGIVPPQPVTEVSTGAVLAIAQAWQAVRATASGHTPKPQPEATDEPARPVAPFGVAGARAAKKRARQAT